MPGAEQGLKHTTTSKSLEVKGEFSSLQEQKFKLEFDQFCQAPILQAEIRKHSSSLLNLYQYWGVSSAGRVGSCCSLSSPFSILEDSWYLYWISSWMCSCHIITLSPQSCSAAHTSKSTLGVAESYRGNRGEQIFGFATEQSMLPLFLLYLTEQTVGMVARGKLGSPTLNPTMQSTEDPTEGYK